MANEGLVGSVPNTSGSSSGSLDTKITFTRGSVKYDSPFLDMTSTFIPRTIRGMLRFLAVSMLTDGLVSQAIIKMAEYPITDLIYNDEEKSKVNDDKTEKKWKKILEEKMKLVTVLKSVGMNYHGYGNAVVSINYPFKRNLVCPLCKTKNDVGTVKGVKFKKYRYEGICPECKEKTVFITEDSNTKEIDKLSIVEWDLFYLFIKFNNLSGDHFYYYEIPPNIKTAIRRGDLDIINGTRSEVIEAVRRRKKLKLKADNVFHFKRSGPQYFYPSERGWGLSALIPVMKDIFHSKILKKGNEMIAFDHIVPLRILFPQGTSDVSPHATINLASWKTKIEDELRKHKADPNYISVMPLPVGQINFSGDAKLLSITPEIKANEDTIITGIGIIPEILRGGASWSGSNVSLRVVENTFLNHRNFMDTFIEWVTDNISRYFDIPKISVRLSPFKMADDLQVKSILLKAAMAPASERIISRDTVIKEFGFDPNEEYEKIKEEVKKAAELRVDQYKADAEAQGEAAIINSVFAADAESEFEARKETHAREDQSKRDEYRTREQEMNAMEIQDELARGFITKHVKSIPDFIFKLTKALDLLRLTNQQEFRTRMLSIKSSSPLLYNEVYNNFKEMNVIEADLAPNMETVQKNTPGEVPSFMQGETTGQEPASLAEQGATQSGAFPGEYNRPLPEVRPPVSNNAPI